MTGVPPKDAVEREVRKGLPSIVEHEYDPGEIHTSEVQLRLDRARRMILIEPREDFQGPRDRMEVCFLPVRNAIARGDGDFPGPFMVSNFPEKADGPNATWGFTLFVDRPADRIGVRSDVHGLWRVPLSDVTNLLRSEGVL